MKNLRKFKCLLVAFISFSSFSVANAQCASNFTTVDNGSGTFSFSNTSTGSLSYYWTFGDGNHAYTSNTTNQYATNGSYSVCLTVVDSINNCQSTFCDTITITGLANPCSGIITAFTYSDNGNGNYTFTNTTMGATTPNYLWRFGDGNTPSSSGISTNANHTYLNNGSYTVALNLYDTLTACSVIYSDTINVTSASPCNITAGFTSVANGNGSYTFTNTSSLNSNNHVWNFGDGTSASTWSPTHTFIANGTFVVQLAVIDSNGLCTDFHIQTIQVSGVTSAIECNAAFVIYADSSSNGSSIVFNTSSGNNLSYLWSFGDGNTSSLQYPNYSYNTTGPFNLCLTVDNGNGCVSTYCDSITFGGMVFKQNGFTIKIQAPVATSIENEIDLISELHVYPNPVKNDLNIELNLTEQSQVEVIASDLTGKIVAPIISEKMNSGINTIKWDTNNLPNGVYLVTIKSNKSIKVKKIVINK